MQCMRGKKNWECEVSSHLSAFYSQQPPSQLCTCINTELGCRAFTCSSSLPLYFFFLGITLLFICYTCLWVYRPAMGCLWKSEDGLGKEVSPLLPPCGSWGLSSSLKASAFPSWAISPALPLYINLGPCTWQASVLLLSELYAQLFSWWWFFVLIFEQIFTKLPMLS